MEKENHGKKIERQAVVIIHGMGEQRPMDTLRSFVDSVKSYLTATDISEQRSVVRSKPDSLSGNYETRRLQLSASGKRPITDFYEFYWAHNMRDTQFSHFLSWLLKLIVTRSKMVPERVKPVWQTVRWMILLGILLIAAILLFDQFKSVKSFFSIGVVALILGALWKLIESGFLSSVGDAGRYFSPTPSNVGERSNIRQQGLAFLRKLHEQHGEKQYDRIVVVAHSLGSVVAYDLLRLLWYEMHAKHGTAATIDQSALEKISKYCSGREPLPPVAQFQKEQFICAAQQRAIGNPWLITDFVTIGAPLCNIDYLLVSNVTFDQLKEQREFPVCPPVADHQNHEIFYKSAPYDLPQGGMREVKLPDQSAMFAQLRWTNIYFSSDFVGGPMQRLFGPGVRDIEVKRKSLKIWPGGHINYWDADSTALAEVVNALKLRGQ